MNNMLMDEDDDGWIILAKTEQHDTEGWKREGGKC